MVNVLPRSEQKRLRRRYYLNLGTLFFMALILVFAVGSVLLLPSYFASRAQADSYERYRDAFSGAIGLKEKEKVDAELASLAEELRLTKEYGASAFSAEIFEGLESVPSSNVTITAMSFSRSGETTRFSLSGVAKNRAALLSFAEALKAHPSFANVSLPVSQLVAEVNPPFSIRGDIHTP